METDKNALLCLTCKATSDSPGRFVRADVAVGTPHFGQAIPCPKCNGGYYRGYFDSKKSIPPGFPAPDPTIEMRAWRERFNGSN